MLMRQLEPKIYHEREMKKKFENFVDLENEIKSQKSMSF